MKWGERIISPKGVCSFHKYVIRRYMYVYGLSFTEVGVRKLNPEQGLLNNGAFGVESIRGQLCASPKLYIGSLQRDM